MAQIQVIAAAYQSEPAAKAAARVLVSRDNLLLLTGGLENGRLCIIESATVKREAVLWVAPDSLKKSLARLSKAFLEVCGLRVGEKCTISVPEGGSTVPAAAEVLLEDTTTSPRHISWDHALMDPLDLAEYVVPGLAVRDVYHRRERRTFRILEVDGRTDNVARFIMDQTRIQISEASSPDETPATPQPATPRTPRNTLTTTLPFRAAASASATASPSASPSRKLQSRHAQSPAPKPVSSSVPTPTPTPTPKSPPKGLHIDPIDGLQAPVDDLNMFLEFLNPDSVSHGMGLSCAAVIQGDKGTGKTMVLNHVAAAGWGTVFTIRPTEKLSAIQEIFQKASTQRPSIVTIDNIHELLVEERSNRASVIQAICDFLDANRDFAVQDGEEERAIELGADPLERQVSKVPQLIVLVTCLDYLKDIPETLRDPGRLQWLIQLPFPEPAGRRAIMRSFNLPFPPDQAEAMILTLSHQTHAFSGHDLRKLCEFALVVRGYRLRLAKQKQQPNGKTDAGSSSNQLESPYLTESDFKEARRRVGPSRMDGIDVKPRPVYWRDIHGQQELVQSFKERVDMMNRPEVYKYHIKPFPRGFLLYGPPGCSKTMAAQALATESELNYFSVKGGELLNQYVGETERGIRDLFAKARRASPAVIFLDEIDALGGRRSDFGDGSASSGRGPQMVPALLSELDGFEPLDKVLVVAATNRPEALDPALLRTGRIDKHFYVPPPDEAARRAIFASWTLGMEVSPDLDLDVLAKESGQLSGAEILGICRKTGESVNRAFLQKTGPQFITTDAFMEEIKRAPRTISPQMLKHFENWTPSFR